jgi:hypothetical protein
MALTVPTHIRGPRTLSRSQSFLVLEGRVMIIFLSSSYFWSSHLQYNPTEPNNVYEFQGGALDGWYVVYDAVQCAYPPHLLH